MNEIYLAMFEAELSGEITFEERCEMMYTEAFMSPVRKFKKKIQDIKKAKPAEYADQEYVKNFVDKYYDELIKCSEILEKEPSKLRYVEVKAAVIAICTAIAGFATALTSIYLDTAISAAAAAAVIAGGMGVVILAPLLGAIYAIISYSRISTDIKVSDDLAKIRTALKKFDIKKLPETYRHKISDITTAIDDAETEMSARLKVTKESVNMTYNEIKLSIYEAADNGEITESEKCALLSELEEKVNEKENESVTLEEAMDIISGYLSEATKYKEEQDRLNGEILKLEDECDKKIAKLKAAKDAASSDKLVNAISAKIKKTEDEYDKLLQNKRHAFKKMTGEKYASDDFESSKKIGKKAGKLDEWYDDRDIVIIRGGRRRDDDVRARVQHYDKTSKLEKKPSGLYSKESVDELRLQVFEAYDAGTITEEDKNLFLEYLDLENYE